ncbi:hypothetical protein VTN96DRAFT_6518 [Rasamsonia emersonii]
MDNLPPSEIAYQEAHINDNRSTSLIVVCSIFTGAALLSMLLRLLARRVSRTSLGLDDYFSLATTISLIGLNISACLVGHFGVGRHLLWVARDPENFIRIGKAEIALSVCYDWSMALGKLSVLALLARAFTLRELWFKIGVFFWATWIVLWWMAGWFIIFLECRPLSTNWGVPTQCRPAFRTSLSTSLFNAVSDVGILILPQPLIWKLRLPFIKKFALSLIFLVGGFATAIGIARIPLLKGANSGATYDTTYTSVDGVVFTVLEPSSVLICACLPTTRSLFGRLPKTPATSQYFVSSSRGSRPSAYDTLEQGQQDSLVSRSQVNGRERLRNKLPDSYEGFELTPTPSKGYGPKEARNFV